MGDSKAGFTVLCDDLTGSSVQSILLKGRGFTPTLQVQFEQEGLPEPEQQPQLLVVNVDTRGIEADAAENRMRKAVAETGPNRRFAKRIDTTLRGHLFTETACLLERSSDSAALVVPAYPASGRTTIGGYQLLNGSLLERTEVARDPVWPISSSYVPNYFQGPSPVSLLPIETVKEGKERIAKLLEREAPKSRIIIADSQNDTDIEAIAEAAASLPIDFIPVDPGPFTAAYVYHTLAPGRRKTALAIIGSTSGVTRDQLEYLEGKLKITYFRYEAGEESSRVMERCEKFIRGLQRETTDLLVIQPKGAVLHGREEEVSRQLAQVGILALQMLGPDLEGLILSGGDTAMGFLRRIGVNFLEPVVELAPLMMGGRIKGTGHNGLKVATKGGLIGGLDGLYRALQWLRQGDNE